MKKLQHEQSATDGEKGKKGGKCRVQKWYNMKTVQHEKRCDMSTIRKKCNMKRVQHKKSETYKTRNVKKVQHGKSGRRKECNTEKVQHEISIT